MTVCSIFHENRLAPFYAFHSGPRPPGSEPSETIFKSSSLFIISQFLSFITHILSLVQSLPPTSLSLCSSFFHFPFLSLSASLYPNTSLSEPTPTPPSALSSSLHSNGFQLWGNHCNIVSSKPSPQLK